MKPDRDRFINRASGLLRALREAEVDPEDVVDDAKSLTRALIEAETSDHQSESARHVRFMKMAMLVISTGLVVLPLFIAGEPILETAIATLGAVGYATALFDAYGERAFDAGKSIARLFQRRDDDTQ